MKADKRVVCINGVRVIAEKENFQDEKEALAVYVGTTSICGGDRRKGGRTYVAFENTGAADMIVNLVKGKDGNGTGFEIAASGDDELVAMACAFAALSAALLNSIVKEDEE